MGCQTCRRSDMPESCGPVGNDPCPCCGMVIIARSAEETAKLEELETQPEEQE
jgi:predicted RNA-binding Zn-ribbon protein involved in translation (DUF1610 family)